MLLRLPVDGAKADGLKPRRSRRDLAHRLLTAALLWFTAGSVRGSCPRPAHKDMILTGKALLQNDFLEGSIATFQCSVGYVWEEGSGTTSCTGGKWTEVTLKCKKKSCGSPGDVQNGRFDFTNGVEFGAIVKAICNEGYEIVGQDYRHCLDKGWTGRIPICEAVQCGEPPEILNGTIVSRPSSEFPQYRDTIGYECNAGYTLIGDMYIMCNANGEYEPQAPECRDNIICEAPTVPNGRRVAGALPPHKLHYFVTFECDSGYEMDGRAQMTCTVNGWSHWPTCNPVKCGEPPEIPNGEIVSRPSSEFPQYLDTIKYECNAGYKLIGENTITCTANRKYEPQAPECIDIICEAPKVPNGRRVAGALPPYKLHYFVTFECDNGYEMDGVAQMTCTVNGWSHWPTCKPVKCGEPPEIPNGKIVSRPSSEFPQYLDTIKYECNAGYTLIGENTITCTANRKYEPRAPECIGNCNAVVRGLLIGAAVLAFLIVILVIVYVKLKKKTGTRDYQSAAGS